MADMVEIIAHRGVPRELPENTLPGFALAFTQGADGVELDVHASLDGVVVVHHDPTVRDDEGRVWVIREEPARRLTSLSIRGGARIPTLEAVLDLAEQLPRTVRVYVEVKAHGIESALVETLSRRASSLFAVHSFDHRIPARVAELLPGTEIGFLSASYPLDVTATLRPHVPNDLWQQTGLIDEPLARRARDAGARLVAWTENDPARAARLVEWGVGALCTDVPGAMRAALEAR